MLRKVVSRYYNSRTYKYIGYAGRKSRANYEARIIGALVAECVLRFAPIGLCDEGKSGCLWRIRVQLE